MSTLSHDRVNPKTLTPLVFVFISLSLVLLSSVLRSQYYRLPVAGLYLSVLEYGFRLLALLAAVAFMLAYRDRAMRLLLAVLVLIIWLAWEAVSFFGVLADRLILVSTPLAGLYSDLLFLLRSRNLGASPILMVLASIAGNLLLLASLVLVVLQGFRADPALPEPEQAQATT